MRSVSIIPLLCCTAVVGSVAGSAQTSNTLQPPSAFVSISDASERSRAIFTEAAKVLTHPRCMNCHPATDRPLQGNDMHPHEPLVTRETACVTCHTDRNFTLMERASYRSIPGHPRWMVAPIEMAWEGRSVGEICRQIKDPARNGGRDLKLLSNTKPWMVPEVPRRSSYRAATPSFAQPCVATRPTESSMPQERSLMRRPWQPSGQPFGSA